jgi:hypothetical protein
MAGVLCGLAMLGYDGIAAAVRVVREQTALGPHEVAIQPGLSTFAIALWGQRRFPAAAVAELATDRTVPLPDWLAPTATAHGQQEAP